MKFYLKLARHLESFFFGLKCSKFVQVNNSTIQVSPLDFAKLLEKVLHLFKVLIETAPFKGGKL